MTDKRKLINPNEAGPQHVDVSGAQEEMMDCYQFGTVPAPDKQQPDAKDWLTPERLHEEAKRCEVRGDHSGAFFLREATKAFEFQAAQIAALREALEKVRQRCLVDEDDGRIAVTCDVVIEYELFDEICAALKGTNDE